MKPLSKETKEFLQTYYPYIKIKKNKITIKSSVNHKKESIEIPSELYPLRNKSTLSVFTFADTDMLEQDSKIAKIFDEQTFRTGFCYSNTEMMAEALKNNRIYDYSTFVGWILIDGQLVHHCWLKYKDKHILDPGITKVDDWARQLIMEEQADRERGREIYVELYKKNKNIPNSQICTFGQVAPFVVYIGTECTPMLGRKIFNELIDKYPNHPAYQQAGMNAHGLSELQKRLWKEDLL